MLQNWVYADVAGKPSTAGATPPRSRLSLHRLSNPSPFNRPDGNARARARAPTAPRNASIALSVGHGRGVRKREKLPPSSASKLSRWLLAATVGLNAKPLRRPPPRASKPPMTLVLDTDLLSRQWPNSRIGHARAFSLWKTHVTCFCPSPRPFSSETSQDGTRSTRSPWPPGCDALNSYHRYLASFGYSGGYTARTAGGRSADAMCDDRSAGCFQKFRALTRAR
eukprot:4933069-Pleurochrysis_carterae.AAC.1